MVSRSGKTSASTSEGVLQADPFASSQAPEAATYPAGGLHDVCDCCESPCPSPSASRYQREPAQIVSICAFEVPPIGGALKTVIGAAPACARSDAGIVARRTV